MALAQLDFILVIPPKRAHDALFTEEHFNALYDHVTAFSLMTYDYSNPRRPGPNAPIQWIQDCVQTITSDKSKRGKILTGLNFYGNRYAETTGGPIIGRDYVKILERLKEKIIYDPQIAEHYFKIE